MASSAALIFTLRPAARSGHRRVSKKSRSPSGTSRDRAIRPPFGDHEGNWSATWLFVSRVSSFPSARIRQISRSAGTPDGSVWNTRRLASGDQSGAMSGRLEVVSR